MRYSQFFIKTLKETPRGSNSINQALLTRGSFVSQVGSGIFAYLPLGLRVYEKVENIIREHLRQIGVVEVALPLLHPAELWKKSGRFNEIGEELIKISTGKVDEFVLAMTHEEVVTTIASEKIQTHKDLPVILGQISKKIRNETRPRGGLIRLKEFQMQDAYSFHETDEELSKTFDDFIGAYKKIFETLELKVILIEADPGMMGGKDSREFVLLSPVGEDRVYICSKCDSAYSADIVPQDKKCPKDKDLLKEEKAIELAHIFKLGTRYAEKMGLNFTDENGKEKLVTMGCYGIGLDRLIAATVEVSHDDKGIIWPKAIAPYRAYLIDLTDGKGEKVYEDLTNAGLEVLFDDRDISAGVKFADADLLGIPYRIVVSDKTLRENKIELKMRNSTEMKLVDIDKITSEIK